MKMTLLLRASPGRPVRLSVALKRHILFRDAVKAILNQKKNSISKSAYYNLKHYLERHLTPYFGKERLHQITENDIESYISKIRPIRKVSNDICFLNAVLRWGFVEGYCVRLIKIKDPEPEPDIDRYMPLKDFKKALKACRSDDDLRLQMIIAYTMGPRKTELCRCRKDQVVWVGKERTLAIRFPPTRIKTKKLRGRIVPVHPMAKKLLMRKMKEPGEYVFMSPFVKGRPIWCNDKSWQWCRKRARLSQHYRWHDFRHSCITNLFMANVNPIAIKKMVGCSPKTLEKYLHVPPEKTLEKIEEAFKLAA